MVNTFLDKEVFSDLRSLIGSFKSFLVGNSLKAYLHTLVRDGSYGNYNETMAF